MWRSSGVNTGWHRIDLPGAGAHSEAVSAQCSPADGSCLVTGQVDGRLALWDLHGDTATAQAGLPTIGVGDQDVIPRPMSAGPHSLVVSPSAGQSVVLSNAAESWATSAGPTGLPVAAALVGDRLYVATRPTAGATANLFVARWPG